MGGGVGISIGAMFRVATEKLLFAMPEVTDFYFFICAICFLFSHSYLFFSKTSIGFVTDVGAGHFLTRLKGPKGIGLYLGLTGTRIGAADCIYTGMTLFLTCLSCHNTYSRSFLFLSFFFFFFCSQY